MSRAVVTALVLMLAAVPLLAQDSARDVEKTVDETVGTYQQTQAAKTEWAREEDALTARYRAARANVEYLSAQRGIQQARVDALNERIGEFERRLTEATRLKDSIQDTLDMVMIQFEDWVEQDLPFLPEERARRVASLKDDMARPDATSAEKLRRLLESLQVEAGYGASVEVTEAQIDVAGEELYVDVLRLGRLALFWKTPDGERVGEFDQASASWVELDGKYRRNIINAMEMATRMRPIELIALPLGRISR
ncbi:DUF3450 domain-containing protein [bacterium]|nr:DUF3450 domain-containing protein [bacterium]HPF35648.1 DUF3450 domain-containing protein [Candidatus Krumholzibacteria bacterium]HRX51332.1 DUF3450 domain-containing protein [Candidatus Krumholzibacteria bacterium]